MDLKTVRGRVEHEGLSFLTITLPAFGKDFLKSLDQGHVDRSLFTGFRWKGGLPRFLGGYLDRVFDRSSGRLLDDPDTDAIRATLMLTQMFGKMLVPCSDARVQAAMSEFVKCEYEVKLQDAMRTEAQILDFRRVSSMLFRSFLTKVDGEIYRHGVVPKHGPGATAEKLSSNGKYRLRSWPIRLEAVFPALEMLLPSASYYDALSDVDFVEPGSETPVRVVSVPKTLKTPRIIGIEPAAMQYSQQGILPLITDGIKGDKHLRSLIGFDDQTPNQEMARRGSLTRDLATLDLSEASDRVSNQLVREMLRPWPQLHAAVDACRSRKADVPGHGVLRLSKFATMGSALCFPFEAMVFTTVIFIGIEEELGRPLCPKDFFDLRDEVRVYGDDLIVPARYVRSVVRALETFGFRVNTRKSYWSGKFRESCGREYYDGHDVSIVKVRKFLPSRREHVSEIISTVSLRNQLYHAGYWQTCRWLDELLSGVLKHYPVVALTSSVLGRNSFLGYETQGMDRELHRPFVKGYVVSSTPPADKLDGEGALLKFLLRTARETERNGSQPTVDKEHLERAGRPHAVNIKLRKACPY